MNDSESGSFPRSDVRSLERGNGGHAHELKCKAAERLCPKAAPCYAKSMDGPGCWTPCQASAAAITVSSWLPDGAP